MSQTKIKPNYQGSLDSSTHWYADEENGITTDGKRFYCPERDELREKWAKARPWLESALMTESERMHDYHDRIKQTQKDSSLLTHVNPGDVYSDLEWFEVYKKNCDELRELLEDE